MVNPKEISRTPTYPNPPRIFKSLHEFPRISLGTMGGGYVIGMTRRSLGHSSVTATSSYIGVTDNSVLDLTRTYSF